MPKVTPTSARKSDHIRINLEKDVQSGLTTGLDKFRFKHNALPETNLHQIDTSVDFFGKILQAPILISSMTGGTIEAGKINQILASAAQETDIAMGVGSQRAAIEDPNLESTYQVRKFAPDILLFANLGAIQLNYGYSVDECQRAIDMIAADALILHLNPLQEAVQNEGDTNFSGLLHKIEKVCNAITVPVIAKEVGWGISGKVAKQLNNAGINAIDIAGAGGTSWTQVEMYRAENQAQARVASTFIDWGIPTAESIIQVHQACPDLPVIASGGIYNGLDIAKCIALGATLGGSARPFLRAAAESIESVVQIIHLITKEIKITMFASGASCLQDLPNLIECK